MSMLNLLNKYLSASCSVSNSSRKSYNSDSLSWAFMFIVIFVVCLTLLVSVIDSKKASAAFSKTLFKFSP